MEMLWPLSYIRNYSRRERWFRCPTPYMINVTDVVQCRNLPTLVPTFLRSDQKVCLIILYHWIDQLLQNTTEEAVTLSWLYSRSVVCWSIVKGLTLIGRCLGR